MVGPGIINSSGGMVVDLRRYYQFQWRGGGGGGGIINSSGRVVGVVEVKSIPVEGWWWG